MMSSSSNARKKQGSDAGSDDDSMSYEPNSDEQPSTSTNEPSTVAVTVSTSSGGARSQTAQPAILPLDTAAVAAAPTAPESEKKARRAGFRDQFLHKLREMLDRESQIGGTAVRWSADGSSFIITDHHRFEEQLIPIYFGNQIAFSSFLRRLQRWGFKRVSNRRNGQYEYSSPTFKRIGPNIAPTAPSLSGMLPQLPLLASNATLPVAPQTVNNMMIAQLLLMLLQRINEEEEQRRAQIDALHQVIIASIVVMLGSNDTQSGSLAAAHRQTVGHSGEPSSQQNERPRNPTGMTVRVEHSHLSQPQQQVVVGAPMMQSVGNSSNIQADLIAFLLQAAQRGDGTAQPPEEGTRAQYNDPVTGSGNDEGGDEEDNVADALLSPRKRKSSEDNQSYVSDENSWNGRLRPRKKSPQK